MQTRKLLVSAAIAAVTLGAVAAKKNSDPVLLTVDKKPVTLSEFMYLYNKNKAQQVTPQSVDEYLGMFVDYKLKVAEAEAEGIDTTDAFNAEFRQFRNELADPYLRDTTVMDSLLRVAYAHTLEDVSVSHIMLEMPQMTAEMPKAMAMADSLRQVLIANPDKWDELVMEYSIDRGSKMHGGSMGWLPLNRTPFRFEDAAYDTPVGQISPVVNSGFGLHIVRPDARRPARGEVSVSHILKLTINKSDEDAAKAEQQIDSIYQVLLGGADFAEVAKAESEDGSRVQGGKLDWFGTGMMVAEFDSVSFALNDGEMSKPFRTPYGWHIVKRHAHRGVPSFEDSRERLLSIINNDERAGMPQEAYIQRLIARYNGRVLPEGVKAVEALISANPGGYDSVAIAQLRVSDIPIYSAGGKTYPVSSIMDNVTVTAANDAANGAALVADAANTAMRLRMFDLERDALIDANPEYRNLVNEYRDGILLFEVSNRNVWDKAAKDIEGLEQFFQANRDKYTWEKPKYKGYILFATSDSLLNEAKAFAGQLEVIDRTEFPVEMRKRFGNDVRVERVLAAQGDNAISDFLVFGGPKPDTDNLRWKFFTDFGGHIAEQPEDAGDVRGAVTTDYQNALEKQWLETIRAKHKVTINNKVLKQIK